MTHDQLQELSEALEGHPPEEILSVAADRFPRITFATGFGAEGCVLIDLIGRHRLPIDIFTLDTGLLFAETYELWRRLKQRYGIQIRSVQPALTLEQQERAHGARLWETDPDRCCEIRKVLALRAALAPFEAWIAAIRRDQTPDRAQAQILERDRRFGLIKVSPLATWSSKDVWSYLRAHAVPYNPLHDRGYASIGCAPCTSPIAPGEEPRAGRWRGRAKTECGLHARPARAFNPLNTPEGAKG
jgi:phosphoadenosine phosphosulfate reductase